MSNLEFAWPYAALCLLVLLPMWLLERRRKGASDFLLSPIAPVLIKLINDEGQTAYRNKINWLMVLLWSLLVLALMRPQYVGDPIEIARDGRNIMLVLDLSESMEAEDMSLAGHTADRLTVAKSVINEFIDKRHNDRIGLVVFGSESFLHAPLSFDHPTIKQFLSDAQIGFAGPKTAIGDAIGLAVKKLIEQTKGERILVLSTDGQNNIGSLEPMQAAEIAKKHGVKIYIVGLGASRMAVNGFFGPTSINPSISLDEAEPEMKQITAMTGGKYFRAKDQTSLAAIYADIDKLEPTKADPVVLIPRKELFYWPVTLVLALMLLRMFATLLNRRISRLQGR